MIGVLFADIFYFENVHFLELKVICLTCPTSQTSPTYSLTILDANLQKKCVQCYFLSKKSL